MYMYVICINLLLNDIKKNKYKNTDMQTLSTNHFYTSIKILHVIFRKNEKLKLTPQAAYFRVTKC